MKRRFLLPIVYSLCLCAASAADFVVYEGKSGPGMGKRLVFLTGDEEYRSEEGMPQMAKILAERHGFHCTVLFAMKNGVIDPNCGNNLPNAEAMDSADAIIMQLRFRQWPDEQMKHFVEAYLAGKPFVALRTSTHAFQYAKNSESPYAKFGWQSQVWPGGFGKQVLGETWVSHLGTNHKEATRGVIEPSAQDDPIMRGVSDIFGDSGVYTVNPPSDAKILLRGQVLNGVHPGDPPLEGRKNNPMQAVAWTRVYHNDAGTVNKIFCTTMGAATDLESEGLRRLVVNAVYWSLGMEVPAKADVRVVGDYKPTDYGFNGFVKGVKPDDLQMKEK